MRIRALWFFPFAMLLCGTTGAQTELPSRTSTPEAIKLPPGVEQKSTLRFSRFRTTLRDGDRIGEIRTGTLCGSQTLLTMNARTEQAVMAPAVRTVREEFLAAGYKDPVRTQQKLFEDDADAKGPDLLLGAMLEAFDTSYCSSNAGARTEGKVHVKIRWELYDTLQRKVVQSRVTDGRYETSGSEAMREGEFFAMAYRDAVRQLLAMAEVREALVAAPGGSEVPVQTAAGKPGPLVLKRVPPVGNALTSNMTLTRAAVVTVTHAAGSGSGFFISESGYVVTNSHVVGNNRFVRVALATGRELVGEVVQRDAGRDVALIKTEGSNFASLAINGDDINVGAEVTAIGSPLGEQLSGTVTRGVVSGFRQIKGRRYIQSDVSVLPGSSGGPLLDKAGRVVGIATAGLGGTRIAFFVPIQEAISSLGITFSQ